uniref:Putative tick transposon n=1 Tax=Rhipicephalus microplus TaxID=6941 RepID=A0A6M2CJU9_RHIMP
MTYGILVWGTTTQTNYQKLLVLQKRVSRAFEQYHGIIRDLKTKPLFEKYALLTITKLYHFKLLQWIKQNKPQCLQNPLDNTHYTMRQQRRKIPAIRTSYGKQHIQYQIPTMLNCLHGLIDFNSVPSNTIIKSILMKHDIEYA